MAKRRPARVLGEQAGMQVTGLRELDRRLRMLGDVARSQAMKSALSVAAQPIEEEWARLAPRSDRPAGTTGRGHAADHITHEVVEMGGRHEANIAPESDFWYLIFPEFGSPHRPALAPGRTAADTKAGEAVRRFRDELRTHVRRAVR